MDNDEKALIDTKVDDEFEIPPEIETVTYNNEDYSSDLRKHIDVLDSFARRAVERIKELEYKLHEKDKVKEKVKAEIKKQESKIQHGINVIVLNPVKAHEKHRNRTGFVLFSRTTDGGQFGVKFGDNEPIIEFNEHELERWFSKGNKKTRQT